VAVRRKPPNPTFIHHTKFPYLFVGHSVYDVSLRYGRSKPLPYNVARVVLRHVAGGHGDPPLHSLSYILIK
ncbi:MAG: hypothetical protein IJA16_04095, partial [Clostridia bacterium]|nr:hypothetical protein [Clostridia bacterium]